MENLNQWTGKSDNSCLLEDLRPLFFFLSLRQVSNPLVHYPYIHNNWGWAWANQKPGTEAGSPPWVGGWTSPCCQPACTWAESWNGEWSQDLNPRTVINLNWSSKLLGQMPCAPRVSLEHGIHSPKRRQWAQVMKVQCRGWYSKWTVGELWSSGSLLSITGYCPYNICEVIGLDNWVKTPCYHKYFMQWSDRNHTYVDLGIK